MNELELAKKLVQYEDDWRAHCLALGRCRYVAQRLIEAGSFEVTNVVALKPGETLIVSVEHNCSPERVQAIKAMFAAKGIDALITNTPIAVADEAHAFIAAARTIVDTLSKPCDCGSATCRDKRP